MIGIEKPRIEATEFSESGDYGKFVLEPLERGYERIKGLSERQIFLVWLWSVLWWLGCILSLCAFLGSLLRVSVLLVFLSCVHESDAISIDGDLRMALALAVCPLRR